MAELILTDEEKAAATYLEWSDEAIGKCVKRLAKGIQDKHGEHAIYVKACASMLACEMFDAGKDKFELLADGVTEGTTEKGSWKITIERVAEGSSF